MKSKGKNFRIFVNVIGVFMFLALFYGCSGTRNHELEKKLITELKLHKTDDISQLDLRVVLGSKWAKICIQSPYMLKKNFEELTGETLADYVGIDDDRYAIWIFYSDGKVDRVEILRGTVMDKYDTKGSICTSPAHPFIYFEMNDKAKKYFINDLDG